MVVVMVALAAASLASLGLVVVGSPWGVGMAAMLCTAWALLGLWWAERKSHAPYAFNQKDAALRVVVRLRKRPPAGRATRTGQQVVIEGAVHAGAWTSAYQTFVETKDGFRQAGQAADRAVAEAFAGQLAASLGVPLEVHILPQDRVPTYAGTTVAGGTLVLVLVMVSLSSGGLGLAAWLGVREGLAWWVAVGWLPAWGASALAAWWAALPMAAAEQKRRQASLRNQQPL